MAHKNADPDKKRQWLRAKRDRRKELIRAAKSRPCADCGIQYPYWVMQFHHKKDKSFTISKHDSANRNIGRVLAEIAKCDVVCANCHADRTYRENL